ncbi:unnamed protein product [Ectocarpus sp. 13 AM-2016]
MDRFASMHDEDIDKLGIPNQGGARGGGGEGGWKGRKRARELSQLKDRLDRASEKEQQSWDLLKQAVGKGGGAAAGEGRFKATGTNRAAEEMRERTVGLVTAEEFRKAREAADSLEEAEAKRRQEEEAVAEEARETARRTAERKKRKSEAKKKRLQKSKMSFALEEDEDEEEAESSGNRVGPQRTDPTSLGAGKPAGSPGCTAVEKEGGDDRPSILPSGQGITTNRDGCGGGMSESRSFKGAAPDEENSSAAAKLRERLGRDQP